jgi:2-phosphoglycerate kinase
MKAIFSALIFMASVFSMQLSAQVANEGARTFAKKSTANGISVVVMGQPKNVEAVLEEKLQKATASKSKNYKGLRVFEGVRAQNISPSTLDIYYEVEKAGKDDDNNSRVTIFLSSGNENFLDSRDYPDEVNATAEMLEGLEHEVNIYEMKLAIGEQEKVIDKAVKDQEKLVKDSVDLEVKLAETYKAIEENKVNRANQLQKIAEEEARLSEFKQELGRLEEQE